MRESDQDAGLLVRHRHNVRKDALFKYPTHNVVRTMFKIDVKTRAYPGIVILNVPNANEWV